MYLNAVLFIFIYYTYVYFILFYQCSVSMSSQIIFAAFFCQTHWTEKPVADMTNRDWRIFREAHPVAKGGSSNGFVWVESHTCKIHFLSESRRKHTRISKSSSAVGACWGSSVTIEQSHDVSITSRCFENSRPVPMRVWSEGPLPWELLEAIHKVRGNIHQCGIHQSFQGLKDLSKL